MISVVIPTRTDTLILRAIGSITSKQPDWEKHLEIIVVDDGLSPTVTKDLTHRGVSVIPGVKPFVFSRNVNIGVSARTPPSDIFLLNDDAVILTDRFAEKLLGIDCSGYGAVSLAVFQRGSIGNPEQLLSQPNRTLRPLMGSSALCFVSVYFPSSSWEKVGPLDERFVGYGYEDDDWCRRATQSGLLLGVSDDVVVFHGHNGAPYSCSFRSIPNLTQRALENKRIYEEKWNGQK